MKKKSSSSLGWIHVYDRVKLCFICKRKTNALYTYTCDSCIEFFADIFPFAVNFNKPSNTLFYYEQGNELWR